MADVSGQWSVVSGQWSVASGQWPVAHRSNGSNPQSPIPNPLLATSHRPLATGFTLVELLVVITIIGMLSGLLMVAVVGARARARVTQCTNNQHELAAAIIQYDTAKRRLPGYVNRVRHSAAGGDYRYISWAAMLLPYFRNDLWDGTADHEGWRVGNGETVRIPQFVCPDDPNIAAGALTYVVNLGIYNVAPTTEDVIGAVVTGGEGVFRSYYAGTGSAISLSSVGTTSRTVMLSERINEDRSWATQPVAVSTTSLFGFTWPNPDNTTFTDVAIGQPTGTFYPPLPAIHKGIVLATFCDGHVESVTDTTLCSEYRAAP